MDVSAFFQAVSTQSGFTSDSSLGNYIDVYRDLFPEWEEADIVLIGCNESRGSSEPVEMAASAASIRSCLHNLTYHGNDVRVADLGNLRSRDSREGTYEALAYVMKELMKSGKLVVLFGGSQDISFGQFLAYEEWGKQIDYVHVDGALDLTKIEGGPANLRFNHDILNFKPSQINNYTQLGYQSYLVAPEELDYLKSQYHFTVRYGELFNQIAEAEPYVRTADMVSFDLSAVRQADAPGARASTPGGFSAMEACQLARYIGASYQLSSFSLTELLPAYDHRQQTAKLASMIIWYLIDGYSQRIDDKPHEDLSNMRKYAVQLHASVPQITFFEHLRTGRWWMEVPFPEEVDRYEARTVLVPCSRKDYEYAKGDNIPERWWLTYHKLS